MAGNDVAGEQSTSSPQRSSSPDLSFRRSQVFRNWVMPWLRTCSAKCFACSHSRGVPRDKRPMIERLRRGLAFYILLHSISLPTLGRFTSPHHNITKQNQNLYCTSHVPSPRQPLFPLVVHLSRILSASKTCLNARVHVSS